uniref:Cysteine protease n=1 Tax=Brachionus plicatilis TaxID=10195 RepID=A0A2Z4EUL3_BRAPC|nr:cysteine protease ATG4-like-2 [Brachionus plicatilis]
METNKKNKRFDHPMNISYFDDHSICHISYDDIKDTKNCQRSTENFSSSTFQESVSFINIDNETLNSSVVNSEPREKSEDSDSSSNGIELEHVKHKLSSLWNNVKYGWSSYIKKPGKIDLVKDEPIFVLGKKFFPEQYDRNKRPADINVVGNSRFFTINEDSDSNKALFPLTDDLDFSFFYTPSDYEDSSGSSDGKNSDNQSSKNGKTALEQEIYSRLWFTYRKDFEPLNGNVKYTTDCGWGCMLRSAQMLIAQGLIYHCFGSEWSLNKSLQEEENLNLYKDIISLFNDRSSLKCPFGLHSLLELADKNDSKVGNRSTSRVGSWFGPTSVCTLMKESLNECVNVKLLENLRIYVAQDCTIFRPDLLDMCFRDGRFVPCIVLIPARLGGNAINEIYVQTLKMNLEMKNCLGIIGGKPKHSLYFFGYQADKVLYLDPHLCQPSVNIYSSEDDHCKSFDNKSFHCSNAGYVSFSKLDPSVALGFYFKNLDEFNEFCEVVQKNSQSEYFHSIFGISEESFEKLQLNYEMFSLDERSYEESSVKSPSRRKKNKEKKGYFDKMLISNNLNRTKVSHVTSSARSGSSKALGKKSNDPDDFVFV